MEVRGEKVRGEGQTKTAERYVFPFEKPEVWQESVELADYVLGLLEHVPQGRHLRLVSQNEGACVEIRRRAEHIDRKLNGLMNSVRGKKREGSVRGERSEGVKQVTSGLQFPASNLQP